MEKGRMANGNEGMEIEITILEEEAKLREHNVFKKGVHVEPNHFHLRILKALACEIAGVTERSFKNRSS